MQYFTGPEYPQTSPLDLHRNTGIMSNRIDELANLGSKSAQMLARAGITTETELRRLGSVKAYLAVKHAGEKPGINLLWVLEGCLSGRRWQDVAREDRLSLLGELERLEKGIG